VLGHCVCLLGGEPALLERKRHGVARGIDAGRVGGAAVGVGEDEPVRIGAKAGDPRSLEVGEGDDAIGHDAATTGKHELARLDRDRHHRAPELDSEAVEHRPDGTLGLGTEQLEGRLLRSHERDAGAAAVLA
jgi:hypothetical protein